jgi:hypothetical protein
MDIRFCIPHVFQSGSLPEENRRVESVLESCASTIQGSCGRRSANLRQGPRGCVEFDLPTCFDSASNPIDNAKALQALLHCLGAVNLIYLQYRPGRVPSLYQSGVYYERTQVWDSIPALFARGYGDCKSLTSALIAEYIAKGKMAKPVFRWIVSPEDQQTNYHILVQVAGGFEDPSKVLGMGVNENAHFKRTG